MKTLVRTLSALALGAAIFVGACVEDGTGNEAQNTTDFGDHLMQKLPEAPGEFSVTHAKDGEYYFRMLGAKGEVILLSEGYVEKPSAFNGILSVEENGVHLDKYETYETTDGEWGFILRAGNGQEIAESQLYRDQSEAEAGIVEARELVAGIVQFRAAMTDGARFDLWKEDDGEWYFVLRAEDGRILLESEGYTGRTGAVNGLDSVRTNGKDLTKYRILEDGSQSYFILKAANGHEIAESGASYSSSDEAQEAINATASLLQSERVAAPW